MSQLEFIVRGQSMTAELFTKIADKAPPKPRRESEPKHGGFAVVGWPPNWIADQQASHDKEHARYLGLSKDERRDYFGSASRPWDEQVWRSEHKQHTLSKRATPDGADALAELARKQGWTEVVVVEVIRGKAA